MKPLLTAAILALVPAAATAEPVIVPSSGSVPETVERLKASVDSAGARVFAMVDFGGRVKSIGEDIDIQLVIFGDPRIGVQALRLSEAREMPGEIGAVQDVNAGESDPALDPGRGRKAVGLRARPPLRRRAPVRAVRFQLKSMRAAVTPDIHPAEAGVGASVWRWCADGAMGGRRSVSAPRSRPSIAVSRTAWAAGVW